MNGLKCSVLVALFVVSLMLLSVRNSAFSLYITVVPVGEVDVKLRVVALDSVNGYGSSDIDTTVKGILRASCANFTYFWINPADILGKLKINIEIVVIHDWATYKEVVETGSNLIIVNAHGEMFSVPSGYTKEEWVDKIAEAMAYRNVTWVHTAGYPFYYYYLQESGWGEWGEEGFKRLMGYIGKNNVTCYPLGPETELICIHTEAFEVLVRGWSRVADAFQVERGRPLKGSDFGDCLVDVIWGTENHYMTGAIVKFAKADQTNSFGFYVHIGTRKTFIDNNTETNGDYYRGYVGTAQAIHTVSLRTASEDAISGAEEAIVLAENEGRTNGLGEARQLLRQANEDYDSSRYVQAFNNANNAVKVANNATMPSFLQAYGLFLAIGSIVSVATAMGLVMKWKKNSRR